MIDGGTHKDKGYQGLGKYNLVNAWQLDKTLDIAGQNGVYCMVTFGYTPEVERISWSEPRF